MYQLGYDMSLMTYGLLVVVVVDSEHILVIGVTRQCPAEGFLPKKVRPAQWKIFAPNRGGGLHNTCYTRPRAARRPHHRQSGYGRRGLGASRVRGTSRVVLMPLSPEWRAALLVAAKHNHDEN